MNKIAAPWTVQDRVEKHRFSAACLVKTILRPVSRPRRRPKNGLVADFPPSAAMIRHFLCALLLAACVAQAAPAGDFSGGTLTNADIIVFAHANMSSAQMISRIQSSNAAFDLSDNALAILRQNGVGDDVLAAMKSVSGSSLALGRVPAIRDISAQPATPATPAAPASPATPAAPNLPALPSLPGLPNLSTAPTTPVVTAATANPVPPPAAQSIGARFDAEMGSLIGGGPATRQTAMAWMLANREQTAPILRKSLEDANPSIQEAALRVLGELKDRGNIVQMRRLLASNSPRVRQAAASALAALDDQEAIGAAEKVLNQPLDPLDGYIRLVGAARLVRASGDLAKILSDSPSAVNRAAAAWSLAEIGRPGAVAWPALESALIGDSDPQVRREASRAVASFHDASSARLLQEACRRDPEVRKSTLQAMAEYPETVEFLVDVMNRGTDQIAADELEAARLSLNKLTGQDLGLDGQRWSAWYTENKARLSSAPPAGGSAATGLSFLESLTRQISAPGAAGRQTDLADIGILVDSSLIPMAPEVDDRTFGRISLGAATGGVLSLPPSPNTGRTTSSGPAPVAPSPDDFAAGPGGYGPAAPASGSGASLGGSSFLRDWSPSAGAPAAASGDSPGPGAPSTQAEPYAYSFQQSEPSFAGGSSAPSQPSLLPSGPVVAPQPADASPGMAGSGLSGISLPLPPMAGLSDPGPASPLEASPAPMTPPPGAPMGPASDPFAGMPSAPMDAFTGAVHADPSASMSPPQTPLSPYGDGGDPFGDSGGYATPGGMTSSEQIFDAAGVDAMPGADPFAAPDASHLGSAGSPDDPDTPEGDYGVISFPDDDNSFGIGGMYFDDPPAAESSASEGEGTAALIEDASPEAGMRLGVPGMTGGDAAPASENAAANAGPEQNAPIRPLRPESADTGTPPPISSPPPPAEPTIVAGYEIPSTIRFVEPEPGQELVGDDLFVDGGPTAPSAASQEYGEPFEDASEPPGDDGEPAADLPEAPIPAPDVPDEASSPDEPDGGGAVVSELWAGPDEYYQSPDDSQGEADYEDIDAGEEQTSAFVGSDIVDSAPPPPPAAESAPPPPPALDMPSGTEPTENSGAGPGGMRLLIPPM